MKITNVDDLYQGQTLYSTQTMGSDRRPHRAKITSMRYVRSQGQIVITLKHGLYTWIRVPESDLAEWDTSENDALAAVALLQSKKLERKARLLMQSALQNR